MAKGLNQFRHFDTDGFFKDKLLEVLSIRDWIDFHSKEVLGKRIEVVVLVDNTKYDLTQSGYEITNKYEKFQIKISNLNDVKVGDQVEIINGQAKVYGDYQNQLSIEADSLNVIKGGKQ